MQVDTSHQNRKPDIAATFLQPCGELDQPIIEMQSKALAEPSEVVQEIISGKSGFMERWALLLFVGLLGSIIFVAWIVKYPDVVAAEGVLSSSDFPKPLVVPGEGRLKSLFVENGRTVKRDEVIGWMESTASFHAISELRDVLLQYMEQTHHAQEKDIFPFLRERFDSLGELQRDYQAFSAALQQYRNYRPGGYFIRKLMMLETDLRQIEEEGNNILKEKQLGEQDLKIAASTFAMNQQLFEQRAVAEDEYRKAQSAFIAKQMAVQRYSSAILANHIRLNDKKKEVEQLRYEMAQQQSVFEQSLHTVFSSIEEWRRKYLLLAPVDGKVTFVAPIQENQYLQQGVVIGFVSTLDDQRMHIETNLRQASFGKIDTGMKAILRFDAYPYQEFGQLTGTVSYISAIPSDSGFLAMIRLDNGLLTSTGRTIPFKDRLKLEVKVVTRDMRLLERFYQGLAGSAY